MEGYAPVLTRNGTMKEEFKFYPRGLAGGRNFYSRPPCEFKGCGKPSDFIAEGTKGSVLYSCCEKPHSGLSRSNAGLGSAGNEERTKT